MEFCDNVGGDGRWNLYFTFNFQWWSNLSLDWHSQSSLCPMWGTNHPQEKVEHERDYPMVISSVLWGRTRCMVPLEENTDGLRGNTVTQDKPISTCFNSHSSRYCKQIQIISFYNMMEHCPIDIGWFELFWMKKCPNNGLVWRGPKTCLLYTSRCV